MNTRFLGLGLAMRTLMLGSTDELPTMLTVAFRRSLLKHAVKTETKVYRIERDHNPIVINQWPYSKRFRVKPHLALKT